MALRAKRRGAIEPIALIRPAADRCSGSEDWTVVSWEWKNEHEHEYEPEHEHEQQIGPPHLAADGGTMADLSTASQSWWLSGVSQRSRYVLRHREGASASCSSSSEQ